MKMDTWAPFLTWQFAVCAVAIVGIVTTIKKAARQGDPALAKKGWFRAGLTLANLLLGIVVAAPPGFLTGSTFAERSLTGLCAGFLSNFVYEGLLKHLPFLKEPPTTPAPAPEPETLGEAKTEK